MEKMNCVKRSISLLVAMCMFGGCSLNVIAAQKYENAQDTYAKEMVGVYFSGTEYETLEGVSLSEAVNLYDLESGAKYGSEYIAFYDESIVGLLYVANNEGEFYSSWRNGPFEGLHRLVKDSSEFAIGFTDEDGVVAYSNNTIYNMYSGEEICKNTDFYKSIESDKVYPVYDSLCEYAVTEDAELSSDFYNLNNGVQTTSVGIEDIILDVTPVANETYNNQGLCWAAAIAAKYNYTIDLDDDNESPYVTASQVRTAAAQETGNNYTAGTPKFITAGLKHYGLLHSYMYNTMNATEIYRELYWKNPIMMDLFTSTGTGHTVLLCGIKFLSSNTAKYYIADSDYTKNGLVEVYVNSSVFGNGDEFVYVSDMLPSNYGMLSSKWGGTYSYKFES